jgi:tetratricopeptide (TPR) repeat protein
MKRIALTNLLSCTLLFLGFGLVSCVVEASAIDLELAKGLIVEGKPVEAYALLEPFEFEQAGNAKFDYLLGLAALNSGQPGKASVILERVLLVDPKFASASVDLGRAYVLLGDSERATAAFRYALTLNPPPAALATISQHLGGLKSPANQPAIRLSGYFEAGLGYNDNVNNSTSQNQISVPTLINTQITLNSSNVKTGDQYLGIAGGGEVIRPVSTDWSLYAGADIRSHNNFKYNNFNFAALDGRVGAIYNKNAEQVKVGLLIEQFNLGGTVNRNANGFNTEWRHSYDGANLAVVFGQRISHRYPDPLLASNDFNQTIAGLGWQHVFAEGRATVFYSLYGGSEHDTNRRIDGAKSVQGGRLSGQSALGDKLSLFASGGVQWGKYNRVNSTFLVTRDDHQSDMTIGINYYHTAGWVLRSQLSLIQNQSNIVVNQYRQNDFSVMMRRDFK